MKITIDMENLNSIIEDVVKKNTEEVLEDFVSQRVRTSLESNFGKIIEEEVSDKMREYIQTYLESYVITVGGGLSEDGVQQYTPREYINKIINNTFRDRKLTTYVKGSYGDITKKEVTFEEFIKDSLDPTSQIKRHMELFAKDVKGQVNSLLKTEYNNALMKALSGVVMDTIMEDEEFKRINDSIKRLSE